MISNERDNDRFEEKLWGVHQSVIPHTYILVKPHVPKRPKPPREKAPSQPEGTSPRVRTMKGRLPITVTCFCGKRGGAETHEELWRKSRAS